MFRLPLLTAVLMLAGPSFAFAEGPLGDPIPPAVVGRPLDHAKPARPVRPKPVVVKPARSKHATAQGAASAKVARQPAAAVPKAGAVSVAQDTTGGLRPAKQAVDDRADPGMQLSQVGKGGHLGRKPLAPGAYFADKHRTAVRKFYAEHPAPGAAPNWRIGEPVPRGATVAAVPQGLLASLPALPPGHSYVQLGGEVVMVAAGSKMVVDGISRNAN